MDLADRLAQDKQEIAGKWVRKALEAYPAEVLPILTRNKDRFANPLPHLISKSIESLFDELLKGVDPQSTTPVLEEIVRIKAVQDFTPSQAVGFVFDLKEILRQHLKNEIEEEKILQELLTIESEIDKMALLSFDIYVGRRQKLFEIQVNEIRNQTHMLVRRVNEMDKQ